MRGIDVVTFTSGSTVENFLKNLATHPKGRVLIANCRIACIGPVTAGVAVKLGLNVDIVARNFTVEGLVEALVEYYKQG
jgi:uroporphyrinogen III methyltransferase/synthase